MDEIKYLYGLRKHGIKLGLEPIKEAMDRLGNPQKEYKIVHVTGTNGKGSTTAMIANVIEKAGHKVGMFTSPHLVEFNERFQVNRKNISDEDLSRIIGLIREKNVELTFFEYATAIAFQYFKEQKVNYAIIEVGLGGTYDSTNIADADIAIITSIGLDHKEFLGNTIEKITKDKCGIINPKSIVVTCAGNSGLPWIKCDNELIIADKYEEEIGLQGEFQKINAGIAYQTCKKLGINEKTIKEGIKTTKWPARLEYIEKNILLDSAHNPAAIKEITKYVKELNFEKLIIIFGALATKDYRKMIKNLPKPDYLILTKPKIEKSLDPIELAHEGNCAVIEEPKEALRYAKKIAQEKDLIVIIGSCYLAGNIKEIYKQENQNKAI